MKTRILLLTLVIVAVSCTSQSSVDDASNLNVATNSPATTSGLIGDVEADELPFADPDTATIVESGNATPALESREASIDSAAPAEQQDGSGAIQAGEDVVSQTEQSLESEIEASAAALTACAIVEAGFIAALDGDTQIIGLYERGAKAAIDSGAAAYVDRGHELLAAIPDGSHNAAADTLLAQCANDGFERLAG